MASRGKELSKEEEQKLNAAVVALAKAIIQIQAYGEENPLAKTAFDDCYRLLTDMIQGREEFILWISEGKLRFGEIVLAEKHPLIQRLIRIFSNDRVISLGFDSRMSKPDLLGLLKTLAITPDKVLTAGGIEKLLEQHGVSSIRVNPVNYELVREGEEIVDEGKGQEQQGVEGKGEEQPAEEKPPVAGYQDKVIDGEAGFTEEDLYKQRRRKILIIDHDKNHLNSMREILKGEGYAVATTRSPDMALQMMRGVDVDLVICDHEPRGLDGIRTL